MRNSIDIEIEGLEDFRDEMQEQSDLMNTTAKNLISSAAATMQSEAAKNLSDINKKVPADAITVTIDDDGMSATVETNIPDAAQLEYGPDGKPFFNPAYETVRTMNYEL